MSLGIRNFAERKTAGTKNQPEVFFHNLNPNEEEFRLMDVNSMIPVIEPDSMESSSHKI